MKVGLSLGQVNPGLWADLTMAADRIGYESVWLPEHLVLPIDMSGSPVRGQEHPPLPSQTPVYDALVYLGYLAGRTRGIRFGTGVYNIGLRHPFATARAAATLDIVSAGRLELGVGASWLRSEWEAVGLDFDSRGARVDEALAVCRELWTAPVTEFRGRFFDFDAVAFEPKPVQAGGPPIHIGGDVPATLRRVARYGDGWLPMNHDLNRLPSSLARLNEFWCDAGRSGRPEITMNLAVSGVDDVRRAQVAGVDRIIVAPWTRSRDAMDGIERFAGEILGRV